MEHGDMLDHGQTLRHDMLRKSRHLQKTTCKFTEAGSGLVVA